MTPNIESAFKGSNAEVHMGNAGLHLLGHLGAGHLVVPHRVPEARNCGPAATPHPHQFPSQTAPKRRQKPSIDPLHSC